jgi:hypothetical protein
MQKFEANGRSPSNYGCLLNAAPHNPGIELGQRENQIRTFGSELGQYLDPPPDIFEPTRGQRRRACGRIDGAMAKIGLQCSGIDTFIR